ncbi:unnamed protein product [Effrenium voratum]|nr:unnamed protein product [Effrenium voratum]
MALAFLAPGQTPLHEAPIAKRPGSGAGPVSSGSSGSGSRVCVCVGVSLVALKQSRARSRGARRAEDLAQAVAEGRMITVEESLLRKALGALFLVLFLWQAFLVSTTGAATLSIAGSSYATLALLASNAVGFGASGFLSL